MKVLITGGYGFLGARLAISLVEKGHSILLGTRADKKPPKWLPDAKPISIDWTSDSELRRVCKGVDAVVHAAGMNAADCAKNPAGALEFNGLGTARILNSAIHENVGKFIYFSTAHVYSSSLVGSFSEDSCPTNSHPYATSHRAGEDVVRFAIQQNKIGGAVVRLSNAYGAPADPDTNCWMLVFNDLCRQAAATGKMKLLSAGNQRRDFISMNDLCSGIEMLLSRTPSEGGMDLCNISGGWTPTIVEVAEIIQERFKVLTGEQPEIIRKNLSDQKIPDNLEIRSDIMNRLGFQAVGRSDKEIDSLIHFCIEEFGSENNS